MRTPRSSDGVSVATGDATGRWSDVCWTVGQKQFLWMKDTAGPTWALLQTEKDCLFSLSAGTMRQTDRIPKRIQLKVKNRHYNELHISTRTPYSCGKKKEKRPFKTHRKHTGMWLTVDLLVAQPQTQIVVKFGGRWWPCRNLLGALASAHFVCCSCCSFFKSGLNNTIQKMSQTLRFKTWAFLVREKKSKESAFYWIFLKRYDGKLTAAHTEYRHQLIWN